MNTFSDWRRRWKRSVNDGTSMSATTSIRFDEEETHNGLVERLHKDLCCTILTKFKRLVGSLVVEHVEVPMITIELAQAITVTFSRQKFIEQGSLLIFWIFIFMFMFMFFFSKKKINLRFYYFDFFFKKIIAK